jgi:alpha,alpha-trehalose phosphorylase (configuration-retaining)
MAMLTRGSNMSCIYVYLRACVCVCLSGVDPQGAEIFEESRRLIDSKYAEYVEDIILARVPACDQLLNCIMRGASIALQLSYAEGFEVKVTEAIMKGIPIIAYNTGGIPLQVKHQVNGYLVEVMKTDEVADVMYQLLNDRVLYERISKGARDTDVREFLTPANAERWCKLLITSQQQQQ